MVNVSAYPVQVDGRRLDDLAVGLETSSHTTGALRSADQPLVGVDGEVASLYDSREPGAFGLGMLVRGTDADGFVPASSDGQATYRRNLDSLRHLLLRTDSLLDVRRCMDKANSAILGTGGRTNLVVNPSFRATSGATTVRRNMNTNPRMRNIAGSPLAEVRRNLVLNPSFETGASYWAGVRGAIDTVTPSSTPGGGTKALRYTADGTAGGNYVQTETGTRMPVTAGEFYTGSIYLVGNVSYQWAVSFVWYDGAGAVMSSAITTGDPVQVGVGSAWTRVSLTAQAPVGAATAFMRVIVVGATMGNGHYTYADGALFEKSRALLPYFDGAGSGSADGLTYAWTGTAQGSVSTASGYRPVAIATNGTPYQYITADGRYWATTSTNGTYLYQSTTGTVGKYYAARLTVRGTPGTTFSIASTDNAVGAWCETLAGVVIPASGEVALALKSTTAAGGPGLNTGVTGSIHGLMISEVLVEEVSGPGVAPREFITGATPAADGITYSWEGTADASASVGVGALPDGWIWTGGALASEWVDTANGWDGPGSLRAVRTKAGPFNTATPSITGVNGGDTIAVSLYYKGSENGGAIFHFKSATGVIITQPSMTLPAGADWTRCTLVATAPAGTTNVVLNLYTAAGVPGDTYAWDAVLIEKNGKVLPYFDGDSAQSAWLGTPQISQSYQDSADVRASCKVVDAVTPEDAPGDYGRLAVVLKVVHGFWRSLTALTWSRSALTSGLWMEVPALEGSSAPINDAVVCLTGPANAGVQVWDARTGTFVRLNEALPAGSVWRVNCDTWQSRVAAGLTVDSPDTAGVDKAGVTDQSGTHPRLLRLYPQVEPDGRRTVKVSVVGTGFTAATSLAIKARRAHL